MRAVGQGRHIDPARATGLARNTGRLARAQYAHNTIDARNTMAHNESVRPDGGREKERERERMETVTFYYCAYCDAHTGWDIGDVDGVREIACDVCGEMWMSDGGDDLTTDKG